MDASVKLTSDGKQVPSRCWYYLLDWNNQNNGAAIFERYKTLRLRDLTHEQFFDFFNWATSTDIFTEIKK